MSYDEKEGGAIVTPGQKDKENSNNSDHDSMYKCTTKIDSDKSELTLEVQHKQTKRIFKGVYPMQALKDSGFAAQYELKDIQKLLECAFNKSEETITLTIS